ncbi:hypothetical protein FB451DRAFT_1248887 [Mycena latifolia]|nr:hypothetical protein FB451DRAFT_1248887 [Mycena latifolia]
MNTNATSEGYPPLNNSPHGSTSKLHPDGGGMKMVPVLIAELANLTQLMAEQTELLRSIEARQASADLSRKPMPQVPATSSSAWNPLLRSFVTETIQPKVDRWRNGLDSLLVFLGLFSAIVTAFLVDSLSTLKQDETAKTNELLLNLTDILILLSDRSNVTFSQPPQFEPDASDIRVNSFYSLSLVLSLSIAALVVAGRGFLNMVTWSPHKKAAVRLTDIHKRWAAAERILRPAIESLPQLLVIPVLLFIAGIVDVLLSTVLQISPLPTLIFVTTSFCLLSIVTVACILFAAFIDGGLNPTTSPFQSSLASLLRAQIISVASIFPSRSHRPFSILDIILSSVTESPSNAGDCENPLEEPANNIPLAADAVRSYHEIVQDTHDDDALDLATSALLDILKAPGLSSRRAEITETERATFIHLLSPEASIRSNRTAAEVFAATYGDALWSSRDTRLFDTAHTLLDPFLDALQRYNRDYSSLSFANMWDSPFILALAVVVGYQTGPIHPVVYIASAQALNWESWATHPDSIATKEKMLHLVWKVLDIKLTKLYLQNVDASSRQEQMHSLIYTSTPGDWVQIDSGALFESLVFLFEHGNLDQYIWIADFVQWIAGWASLDVLIVDVLRILRGDMLEQRWVTWTMKHNFFACIELMLNACATRPDALSGRQMLNLCMLCTSNALRCIDSFVSPLDSLEFVTNFPRTLAIALSAIKSVQMQMLPPPGRMKHRAHLLRTSVDVVKIKEWMDRLGDYAGKSQIEDDILVVIQHIAAEKAALGEDLDRILSAETATGISLSRPLRYMSFTRTQWITEQGNKYEGLVTHDDLESAQELSSAGRHSGAFSPSQIGT